MLRLRAICFDLDDTLWHTGPAIAHAEAQLHRWLHDHYPRIAERWSLEDLRAARAELAAEAADRAHDFTWLRTESMLRHARAVGYPDGMAEEAFEVFFEWRNRVEPFEDVAPALSGLRGRYLLATLSNGNADLARIGLARHFTVSLAAGTLGVAKPARSAFAAIATALGCAPQDVLYVGDDPRVDVAGARAAGLRTAWLNRFARPWPAEIPPADLVASDLHELVRLLPAAASDAVAGAPRGPDIAP